MHNLPFLAARLLEHCLRCALSCYSYVSIPFYFGAKTIFPKPNAHQGLQHRYLE